MPDTAEGTATHMRANRQTKELSGIELLIEIRILIHFFDCCMNQTSNSAGGLRRGEGGKGGGELTGHSPSDRQTLFARGMGLHEHGLYTSGRRGGR